MMKLNNVIELFQCPTCGGVIDEELKCAECGKKYSSREGVYILIDRKSSGIRWKWDRRTLSKNYRADTLLSYDKLISSEIRKAREKWWEAAGRFIEEITGVTVDIGTGMGLMLEKLMDGRSTSIIATDIDPSILLSTSRAFGKSRRNDIIYLSTDARKLALKDGIADYVTSFAGINNITGTSQVLSEVYRIMKDNATFLMMEAFVDEGTESADLADDYGLKDGYISDSLIPLLESQGFRIQSQIEASSAIWRENPMDVFPVDGDRVYYCIIEAVKKVE